MNVITVVFMDKKKLLLKEIANFIPPKYWPSIKFNLKVVTTNYGLLCRTLSVNPELRTLVGCTRTQ